MFKSVKMLLQAKFDIYPITVFIQHFWPEIGHTQGVCEEVNMRGSIKERNINKRQEHERKLKQSSNQI